MTSLEEPLFLVFSLPLLLQFSPSFHYHLLPNSIKSFIRLKTLFISLATGAQVQNGEGNEGGDNKEGRSGGYRRRRYRNRRPRKYTENGEVCTLHCDQMITKIY